MILEDSIRFQLWRQGMLKLGLKVEQRRSCSWELLDQESSRIATITYEASKPFDYRFSFASKNDMQSTEELENELSEYKSQVKKLQKALEHETEDAKRYYVFWRKYPDLERQNKRLQEQVDAFEAAPLKILDDWIAANGIDLQSGRADALRAYREYLLRSSRSL